MWTRPALRCLVACAGLIAGIAHAQALPDGPDLGRTIDGLLRSELNEHWYPAALDRERGGFHQNFARDWTHTPDQDVFVVYQARVTWTASPSSNQCSIHSTTREGELMGSGAKASPWKANSHTARAMMNVVQTWRKLGSRERGEETSYLTGGARPSGPR